MRPLLLQLLSIGILTGAPLAQAYEWQISAGQGVQPKSVEQHQLFRVAWRSDLPWSWYESKTGRLSSGIALGLGIWHGDEINTGELFITPALRYEWAPADNGAQFFIEAGVGGHLFSRTDFAKRGAFSTAFQFGEQLGAGVRFGEKREQDLTLLYQHHSNADIKTPNYGADFIVLRYGFKM